MTFEPYAEATELDARDPLREFLDEFLPTDPELVAYLDGNSLGRPTKAAAAALDELVHQQWAGRLIRGWTDEWMQWPELTGDLLAEACLGAAPGQTVVADSTTVMLYKLARAAVGARPDRDEIVLDSDNFPTDRYVLEGIARECGLTLRWITTDPDEGVRIDQVREVVGDRTALVVFSHVAYRSGWLADAASITAVVHEAGALMLWDLCHSVGVVPLELDSWGVDVAVGCTYKYLNGGPGAPAFGYVRSDLHGVLHQPVHGWMGRAEPFEMAPGYVPANGIRSFVSGTPPVVGMVPVRAGIGLIRAAGVESIRRKSLALTDFAMQVVDSWPVELGVQIASPRDEARRGGHVTIRRADFRAVNDRLWQHGVVPDFRAPDGIRLGLAPLSTTFREVADALSIIRAQIGDPQ